jgi:hypothetical protein
MAVLYLLSGGRAEVEAPPLAEEVTPTEVTP